MFIGGKPIAGNWDQPVYNPYSGEQLACVPIASSEEVAAALEGAGRAEPKPSLAERVEVLKRVAEHYRAHRTHAARLICAESGLCLKSTLHEVDRSIRALDAAADWAPRILGTSRNAQYCDPTPDGTPSLDVLVDPVSLAVAVTPFNHPLHQVVHKVAPALAAGSPLVLKPSEQTPLSALYLAQVLHACGLPPHMFNVVTGGVEVVEALVTHRGTELVSFTGSVAVGKRIARLMAGHGNELVRYVPELGGNSALAVMADADVALASDIALGAFSNSGQRCTGIKRILVHRDIEETFTRHFLERVDGLVCGNPADSKTDVGTLITKDAAVEVQARVEAALASGARLRRGHRRRGALYVPTVLDQVSPDMTIIREETFGPVAPLVTVSSLQQCVELVRAGPFRLAGAIVTASEDTARSYAAAIGVGQFSWNGSPSYRTEVAPFGGFGDSGNGEKEGIVCAIESHLRKRTFYTHYDTSVLGH